MMKKDGKAKTERSKTGVSGLDDILSGGLTPHRLYLLDGDPGSGKTTLSLQFLLQGLKDGDKGLYITLSETKEELIASSNSPEEIRKYLGADSLGYLSLAGLRQAVNDSEGQFCTSCYTGVYPTDLVQLEVREGAAPMKVNEAVAVEHES